MTDQVAGPGPSSPQESPQRSPQAEQDGPAWIRASTTRTFSHRTWSLRRRLGYAFAIAGGLLAVGCLLGGLALNSMISAVNLQINRLDPAARDTSYLLSSLLSEQTGVRGYIITRQEPFLAPFHLGLTQTAAYIAGLHGLVDPYPALRSRLRTVQARARVWRVEYAGPAISAIRRNGTVSVETETTGASDFGQVRAAITALDSEILAERDVALRRLHSATTDVIVLAITGAALLIAAGAAAWAAMSAWVTGPLAALGAEAQAVASGGLGHVLKVSGPREIMELAADVEAMRRQLLSGLDDLSFKATELERSNRELEQFAYVASHDLQEPLRKVASFCQMLESRYAGQLDDRAHQYIAFAVDGAKRMQLLINELLTFSRVGQPGTVRGPVDLNSVANEAADRLDATIADADGEVRLGDLPTVNGDPTLLTQLFQNLIANSIKFRRLDEHPVITITAEHGDDVWNFACRDNGIGIAPAHAERVFIIFQRLHPRDAYPGTGIGLALCRKIVDFHGGQIWVDTTAATSEGTTIRWTLPESDGQKEAAT